MYDFIIEISIFKYYYNILDINIYIFFLNYLIMAQIHHYTWMLEVPKEIHIFYQILPNYSRCLG